MIFVCLCLANKTGKLNYNVLLAIRSIVRTLQEHSEK